MYQLRPEPQVGKGRSPGHLPEGTLLLWVLPTAGPLLGLGHLLCASAWLFLPPWTFSCPKMLLPQGVVECLVSEMGRDWGPGR